MTIYRHAIYLAYLYRSTTYIVGQHILNIILLFITNIKD